MKNTREIGSLYEERAAEYLKEKGYEILHKNYRIRQSEIDIIARAEAAIVFVEVKYRENSNAGNPFESVDIRKQKRISRAAKAYIYQNGLSEDNSYRFDVIGILGDEIVHIEDVFWYVE